MRRFLKLVRKPQWGGMPDGELADHFQRTGAEEAANELFRRYAHLVYGACRKYLHAGSEEDWRDATMVAFEHLFAQLQESKITSSLASLLYAITRNVCISQTRKAAKQSLDQGKWEDFEKTKLEFMENGHFQRLYSKEENDKATELLEDSIAQLDPAQRTCILLFYYERKSYQEITAITGFSSKQVKSYLQNGKRSLRLVLVRQLKETDNE